MTRCVLGALLLANCASLLPAAQDVSNSGQWLIDFLRDGRVQLSLHMGHHEHSFPIPAESFHGLTRTATHFDFARDAGTFVCDGHFEGDHGAGTFTFHSNAAYVPQMASLGYQVEPERLMELAVFDVSPGFVKELQALGYRGVALDDLVRFRIHGVSSEFIQALGTFGYRHLTPDDLVDMQIHGVSTEFIRDLKAEGYSGVPVEELIRMRIHGVTPAEVRKVRAAGFSHPTTDQLVEMRIHGLLD